MTWHKSTLNDYERSKVLKVTSSKGNVYEIDDSERQECERYSRVMGYLRPISIDGYPQWNPGKVSEFNERKWFKMPKEVTNGNDS